MFRKKIPIPTEYIWIFEAITGKEVIVVSCYMSVCKNKYDF